MISPVFYCSALVACFILGAILGYTFGSNRKISKAEASQVLAQESAKVRKLLKRKRQYYPEGGSC